MRLIEKIDSETQDEIYEFLFNHFVDNNLGLSKFTKNVADIIVSEDTIDLAFDFREPTGTEVEVTQKHIDSFMVNDFPSAFFRKKDEYPTFRLQPVEHRWDDKDEVLYCLYDVIRLPRYQRKDRVKDRSI